MLQTPLIADNWYILVSPWKPFFGFAAVLALGWLASSKLDKDAQYFHLPRRQWNLAHLLSIIAGLAVMWMPIEQWWWFYAALPLGLIVMSSSTLAYWWYRNRNVPADKRFYLTMDSVRHAMAAREEARALRSSTLALRGADGKTYTLPPSKDDPLHNVHIAMEEIIGSALLARSEVIEMGPTSQGPYQVFQTVDGVRYKRDPIDPALANAIIDYLKTVAGMDASDKRRKQVADLNATYGAENVEMRLRTAGSSAGQALSIDVEPRRSMKMRCEQIGMFPRQLETLEEMTRDQHGVVLVAAGPNQGRTTTLYALIRRHDAFTNNVRTLELEQLAQIDGVGHMEFKPTGDSEYAIQIRSMLRRDPHILVSMEIPDERTAKEIAAPGLKGPLIYASLVAEGGMEALAAWARMVGDLETAAAPLRGVVAEKLLRTLCPNCRVPYRPAPEQLKRLNLQPDQVKQLYKASGKIMERNREETCPNCGGLGYLGQTGAFEIYSFDDEARKLIAKGDLNSLKTHLRRQKYMSIQEAALRKALEGVTSIEEVMRVTQQKKSSSSRQPSGTAPAA